MANPAAAETAPIPSPADSGWLPLLLTALAVIVPLLIYVLQRRKRRLGYRIKSKVTLIDAEAASFEGLEVRFNTRPISKALVYLIEIVNGGNVPIKKADFETPLRISIARPTQILAIKLEQCSPDHITPCISHDDNSITIEPLLLNPNDAINIAALTTGNLQLSSKSRIEGVNRLESMEVRDFRHTLTMALLFLSGYIILIFEIFQQAKSTPRIVLAFVFVLVGLAMLFPKTTLGKKLLN